MVARRRTGDDARNAGNLRKFLVVLLLGGLCLLSFGPVAAAEADPAPPAKLRALMRPVPDPGLMPIGSIPVPAASASCRAGIWLTLWSIDDPNFWTFCVENFPILGPVICGLANCILLDATLNDAGALLGDTVCRVANCTTLAGVEHLLLNCAWDLVFHQDVCILLAVKNPLLGSDYGELVMTVE